MTEAAGTATLAALSPTRRVRLGLSLLLVAMTLTVYVPAMQGGFVWDDDAYVTQNPLLTAPDGLKHIWFSTHTQSQYFPLVYTTLRFERALWGLNPIGYHVVNVLLHGMNALLVWAVLRRLALPGAWLAAAIWAVHPVNVESVAWITELKNTQSTLFYLLALLAWMKFAAEETERAWRFYALALLLYALALFSKTIACTLPAAMLLVLWARNEPIGWRRCVQVAPFVIVGLAMGLLSVWWEAHLGNYRELNYTFRFSERLLIATRALWFYAAKVVWPTRLAFSYARWEINSRDPWQYAWLIGCLAVAWLLWWRRSAWGRAPVAAIAFFVASLSPLLGFIPLYTFRYTFVADHYQYVASIGLIILFTVIAVRRTVAWQVARNTRRALSFSVLLVLGTLTWRQAGAYRDAETLWRDTLTKNPDSFMANNNLGGILLLRGELEPATALFERANRSEPDFADGYNNLGLVRHRQGRLDEADSFFREALGRDRYFVDAHNNLGILLAQQGRSSEALEHFQEAVRFRPSFAKAHQNLGLTLEGLGRTNEAVGEYRETLRLTPDARDVEGRLAWILATDPDPGVRNGAEAVRLSEAANAATGGRDPRALDVLAAAYAEAGRFDDAVRAATRALDLAGASASAEARHGAERRLALYRAGRPFRSLAE
jgi:Flp pilus assembly protein TadD